MNFCTECKSVYEKPGTCNCYATVAKPVQPQPVTPYIPWQPYTPTYPTYIPWWQTVTVTGVDVNTPVTGTTVSANSPWFKNTTYTA